MAESLDYLIWWREDRLIHARAAQQAASFAPPGPVRDSALRRAEFLAAEADDLERQIAEKGGRV